MKQLVIEIATLPEEGKQLAGALSEEIFDLTDSRIRPLGPLAFDLRAQSFENELLLTGSLSAPFELECSRTLTHFKQTIRVENTAIALEINNQAEIDATEALREEILLGFPNYPRCDEGDDPMPCEINPRYLAVDKAVEADVENPPAPQADTRWDALDEFKKPKSES